jgi:hypothetical protein
MLEKVWIVSNEQLLDWVRHPVPASQLNTIPSFQCTTPEVSTSEKVCNGIPRNEEGLLAHCAFSDFPFYTCVSDFVTGIEFKGKFDIDCAGGLSMDAQLFNQALGIPTRRRIYLMDKANATDVSNRYCLKLIGYSRLDSASELLNPFLGPHWRKMSLQHVFLQFQ